MWSYGALLQTSTMLVCRTFPQFQPRHALICTYFDTPLTVQAAIKRATPPAGAATTNYRCTPVDNPVSNGGNHACIYLSTRTA